VHRVFSFEAKRSESEAKLFLLSSKNIGLVTLSSETGKKEANRKRKKIKEAKKTHAK